MNNLLNIFETNNFENIYNSILNEASIKKQNSEKSNEIETLFSPQILNNSNYKWDFYSCVLDNNKEDYLKLTTNYKNYDDIKNFKLNLNKISLDNAINKIITFKNKVPIIINRYFMSFVIVRVDDKFIIIDSHTNKCGYIEKNNIKKYVVFDDYSENIITFGFPL
jgi:hypothetical protein